MYADRYDTIFYINNALLPVRNTSQEYNWRKTVPGNTSKTLWTNFRTEKELPQYINPASGFLFNTNHSPFLATAPNGNLKAADFAKTDGWEEYNLNRSTRFMELFPLNEKLSYDKFKQIKFDLQLPEKLQYPFQFDSLFFLSEVEFPQLATVITTFKKWNKRGDADNKGAAVFLLIYEHLKATLPDRTPRYLTKQEAIGAFTYASNYMQKNFGRKDLTLGELQVLVRGDKEWPLSGFPDLLSPQWTEPMANGKLKSIGGDGLVMFVRFQKQGLPKIETINVYGASAKPGNKHFDNQVEMYLKQQTKAMTLDKATVYKAAERVYHPQ
jgi:acyl-homoserine-lactone acylase